MVPGRYLRNWPGPLRSLLDARNFKAIPITCIIYMLLVFLAAVSVIIDVFWGVTGYGLYSARPKSKQISKWMAQWWVVGACG